MTDLPFLWFFVCVLVGGVITLSGMMAYKQLDSNGVWGALPSEDVKDGGKAFMNLTEAVINEQQQLFPDGKF